jgi:hypoxanthine phosphoribosyltransferase
MAHLELESEMRSYDYANREGVEPITWNRFAQLSRGLAEHLEAANLDLVIGVARGGLFPATAVACALRCEFFPVRLSRREADAVQHEHPVWRVPVGEFVRDRRVAVIDDVADTGETLEAARQAVIDHGASSVVTATLVSHSWANPAPDFAALRSDALTLFPWDQEVLVQGSWVSHPETEKALRLQSRE